MINNNNITRFQLVFLLIHSQIGINIISLPNTLFMYAKTDSWISILIAGVIIQIFIYIYGILLKRFPSYNFYEIIQILLGKWVGKIIISIITLYFIWVGGIFLARFSVIISAWMMPLTPKWVLAALVLLTAVYITIENLQKIARFMFIATFTFPIYIIFTTYALKDANFTYIFPVGNSGMLAIMKGALKYLSSIHGVELLLFIYPFVSSNHTKIIRTASFVNIFITLYYTFFVVSCLLIISPKELKMIPEPVLYLVKSFTFKILERPDLLITTLWIVIVTTTFVSIIYISSLGLSVLINKDRTKSLVFIVSTLIFMMSLTIGGIYELSDISKFLAPFILTVIFIIPTCILFIAIFMNKKECDLNE